jgi:hypothetical protein
VVNCRRLGETSHRAILSFSFLKEFKAHDRSQPRSAEIYAELDRLSCELKEHGHEFDSSWITRPLQEGESIESVLCGHSEKLAIAFNLMQRPRPSVIQITKNLRVCGDCRECPGMSPLILHDDVTLHRSCDEVDCEDSSV